MKQGDKMKCSHCNDTGIISGRGDFHDDGETCTMIACEYCKGDK